MRAGKFKIPFGLDQTSGETKLDFVYRSLGGDYLSPGRDIGVMVHGRFFKRGLNYWGGGSSRMARTRVSKQESSGGDETFAGARHACTPLREGPAVSGSRSRRRRRDHGNVSDEPFLPNGLRGRTVVSQYTFFEPMFVKGTRKRMGTDVRLDAGHGCCVPSTCSSADARNDQGIGDEDLLERPLERLVRAGHMGADR